MHPRDNRDDEARKVGNNQKNSIQAKSDKVGQRIKQNVVKVVKICTDKNLEDS